MTTMSLNPVANIPATHIRPVTRQGISISSRHLSDSLGSARSSTMSLRQRRRLARSIFSLSLMIVIGAGFSAVSSASDSHTNNGTNGFVKIVVGNGQSLWNIATIINKNDPTAVVDEIVSQNNLHSADVTTGQSIWVPTK